jgi:hypothetical protein
MKIPLTDAELSQLFGHACRWAQGMIDGKKLKNKLMKNKFASFAVRVFRERNRARSLKRRGIGTSKKLVQYCQSRQAEKNPTPF